MRRPVGVCQLVDHGADFPFRPVSPGRGRHGYRAQRLCRRVDGGCVYLCGGQNGRPVFLRPSFSGCRLAAGGCNDLRLRAYSFGEDQSHLASRRGRIWLSRHTSFRQHRGDYSGEMMNMVNAIRQFKCDNMTVEVHATSQDAGRAAAHAAAKAFRLAESWQRKYPGNFCNWIFTAGDASRADSDQRCSLGPDAGLPHG